MTTSSTICEFCGAEDPVGLHYASCGKKCIASSVPGDWPNEKWHGFDDFCTICGPVPPELPEAT